MENRRALTLGLTLAPCFLLHSTVFAYEQQTHGGLTQATVETHQNISAKKLQPEEISAIVRGSSDEDADKRPVNHFYDPIYERGLTLGPISWAASKRWAEDTRGQAGFCIQYFCRSTLSYADKYFGSPQDYSWERAVYEYTYGDKRRGLEALGHVLHLLQDATVPAHVRNDQHLNNGDYGDFDPYEQFTSKFEVGNIQSLAFSETLPQRSTLSAYFDAVAAYTSGHFLSKDAMFDKYTYPNPSTLKINSDGFGYDPVLNFRVAKIELSKDFSAKGKFKSVALKDEGDYVLNDYWSLLSRVAIRNGAGVVDLFFQEVEKEKQTKELKKKNISQQEIDAKKVTLKGFSLVKKLYGSSLDESDVFDLLNNQQAAAASAFSNGQNSSTDNSEEVNSTNTDEQGTAAPTTASPPDTTPVLDELSAMPTIIDSIPSDLSTTNSETPVEETGSIVPISTVSPNGGALGGGVAPQSTPTPDPVVVTTPSFTAPTANAALGTTTVTISGTADAGATVTLTLTTDLSTQSTSTTASVGGIWSLSTTTDSGTTTVSAQASDGNGNTSSTSTRSFSVDTIAPSVSVFSLYECAHPLVVGSCTTAGSAHPAISAPSSDVSYYNYIVDGTVTATASSLGAVSLTLGSHTVAVAAYDAAGNGATSTSVTIHSLSLPISISEVAWAGTAASASDTWIELFNRSSSAIDMSQVALTSEDGNNLFYMSGTIAAGGYYLIEKSETATDVQSDFVASNLTLSSTPTQLNLVYTAGGTATSTLDSTPLSSTCSGAWCAGTSDTDKRSMERRYLTNPGTLAVSWNSNNTITKNGNDSAAAALSATPKALNSIPVGSLGYVCDGDTSNFYVEGGFYSPASGSCRFTAPYLTGGTHRNDVFAGVVGNSVLYAGNSSGSSGDTFQSLDAVPSQYQVQGQDLFAVMFITVTGPFANLQNQQFIDYFTTGAGSPPSTNYGILRYKWGQ